MVSKTAVCTALAPVAVGLFTLWWKNRQKKIPGEESGTGRKDKGVLDERVINSDDVPKASQTLEDAQKTVNKENISFNANSEIKTETSHIKKEGPNAEKIPDDLVTDGSLTTPHIGQNLEEPEFLTDFHVSEATSTSASVCGLQGQHTDGHVRKTASTAANRSHDQHGQDSHPISSSSVSRIDSLQEDAEMITDDQVNNSTQNNSTSRSHNIHDAVILHADDDRELAKRLRSDLQQKTSLDDADVVLYEEFAPDIGSHLQTISAIADRSCYLLVLVTPKFTQSTLERFQNEIALMDSIESRSERIIPVWGSSDAQSLLLELSILQGIDYHSYITHKIPPLSFFDSMRRTFIHGRKNRGVHK